MRRWIVQIVPVALCLLSARSGKASDTPTGVTRHVPDNRENEISASVSRSLASLGIEIRKRAEALRIMLSERTSRKVTEEVDSFLQDVRRSLLEDLGAPELAGLRAYVSDQLKEISNSTNGRSPYQIDRVVHLVDEIHDLAEERQLTLDLCVSTKPWKANVSLFPLGSKYKSLLLRPGESTRVYRGLYAYTVENQSSVPFKCPHEAEGRIPDCTALDLWSDLSPTLNCDLRAGVCQRLGKEALAECLTPQSLSSKVADGNRPPVPTVQAKGAFARSGEISSSLAQRIPATLAQFSTLRRRLRIDEPGETQSASGVTHVLDSTQISVEGALKEEELAALRDVAVNLFAEARHDLMIESLQGGETSPIITAFASFRRAVNGSTVGRINRNKVETWFDKIADFLQVVLARAQSRKIVTRLCIVSQPDGARFSMHAPSRPERTFETITLGELPEVYIGFYAYEIRLAGVVKLRCEPQLGQPAKKQCAPIDLWDDLRPVLDCDLDRGCRRRERSAADCTNER